jgi:hypothetical protein
MGSWASRCDGREGDLPASITVQITADSLRSVREGRGRLVELVSELGLRLRPTDPGTPDRELERFFIVEVPDETPFESTLDQLRSCGEVQAAYVKPPEGPPS